MPLIDIILLMITYLLSITNVIMALLLLRKAKNKVPPKRVKENG